MKGPYIALDSGANIGLSLGTLMLAFNTFKIYHPCSLNVLLPISY